MMCSEDVEGRAIDKTSILQGALVGIDYLQSAMGLNTKLENPVEVKGRTPRTALATESMRQAMLATIQEGGSAKASERVDLLAGQLTVEDMRRAFASLKSTCTRHNIHLLGEDNCPGVVPPSQVTSGERE